MSIGIIAIKGGVGKTTIAASLATTLVNHFKKKVLLVDANYSAPNLGLHMDIVEPVKTIHDVLDGRTHVKNAIHSKFGVHVIPGSYVFNKRVNFMRLKDKLNSLKRDYDFVIIDSSPTLNEEILSTMLAADHLFVVTTPDYPTLSCSLRAAKLAHQRGRPIKGIIINKVRDPDYELTLNEIEEATGIPVIASLPDEGVHSKALFTRIPVSLYAPKSKFSKELNHLGAALTKTQVKTPLWKKIFGNVRKEETNRLNLRDSFYTNIFPHP